MSFSPTFNARLFCTKVLCVAFLYVQFGFVSFWRKNIGAKVAHKTLMKLATEGQKRRYSKSHRMLHQSSSEW